MIMFKLFQRERKMRERMMRRRATLNGNESVGLEEFPDSRVLLCH